MEMTRLLALSALALLGCLTTACGDDPQCAIDTDCPLYQRCTSDNRCVALGTPDATPDASDAMPTDAGSGDTGVMDAGLPDATLMGTGTISLLASSDGTTSASASFSETPAETSCTSESILPTPCEIITCTRELPMIPDAGVDAAMDAEPAEDASVPDASIPANAGAISVTGSEGMILLLPTDGLYSPNTGATPWTAESASVEIDGAGSDDISAFSLAWDAPSVLQITNDPSLSSISTLARGTNFTITWTGSSREYLEFTLEPTAWEADETSRKAVACRFPIEAGSTEGSAVVQGSIIGRLPIGRSYRMDLRAESTTQTMAGTWLVNGHAQARVTTLDGSQYNGSTITIGGS